jgi:hypothetical protein
MADITHLFLRRHLRSGPTAWTRHSVGGRVRHEGVGLSYAFRARTAVISEVPVEDRELSLVAHARTADQAAVRAGSTARSGWSSPSDPTRSSSSPTAARPTASPPCAASG